MTYLQRIVLALLLILMPVAYGCRAEPRTEKGVLGSAFTVVQQKARAENAVRDVRSLKNLAPSERSDAKSLYSKAQGSFDQLIEQLAFSIEHNQPIDASEYNDLARVAVSNSETFVEHVRVMMEQRASTMSPEALTLIVNEVVPKIIENLRTIYNDFQEARIAAAKKYGDDLRKLKWVDFDKVPA